MVIDFTIVSILWYEWIRLKQTVDITPIHAILSQVVVPAVTERDVLTDRDSIEVLRLQQHMFAVDTDSVALVVRSPVSTHDTFITSIGVRHHEL